MSSGPEAEGVRVLRGILIGMALGVGCWCVAGAWLVLGLLAVAAWR